MGLRIPTRQATKVLTCILLHSDLNTIIHVIMALGEMFYNTIGGLTMKVSEMIAQLEVLNGDLEVILEVMTSDGEYDMFDHVGIDTGFVSSGVVGITTTEDSDLLNN